MDGSPYRVGQPEYEQTGNNKPGAPQMQLLRFVGAQKGYARVTVALRRPWTGGRLNAYKFDVKSGGKFRGTFIRPEAQVPEITNDTELSICAAALPSHFDWREQNAVTPVRDQESCGSCWAFGAAAAMEAKIKIKDGLTRDYSEQYLVSCNSEGYSCSGGWRIHNYHTMKCLPSENGADARLESEFPYQGVNAPCNPPHTPMNNWKDGPILTMSPIQGHPP